MKITQEQERIAFYHVIGWATTQWTHVEYGLALLAATCQQPSQPAAAFAAFRAVENFRSKLALTDAAVRASSLGARALLPWEGARRHVEGLSTVRNKIAHDRMVNYPEAPEGRRFVLVSKNSKPTEGNSPPSDALGFKRIHQAATQFAMASCLLHDIVDLALGREPQLGEEFQKERPTPQLAQLVRQMREGLAPPP